MANSIEVILSPSLSPLYEMDGKICVVIDVLRATTTLCAALDNGASSVIPVRDVERALELQKEGLLVGGERNGIKIPEFDFGNSPKEYLPERVANKHIVLTTTNGTRAIDLSEQAQVVIAGSFVNITQVVDYLERSDRPVVLFCAGWKNKVNLEDSLFAAEVISRLSNTHQEIEDAGILLSQWRTNLVGKKAEILDKASHVQRFRKLGVTDLEYCVSEDIHPVLPVLIDGKMVDQNRR